MTTDPRLQKLKEAFTTLNSLLDNFKNSPASDLPKDLKFYRTVYGKVVTPAVNSTMVTVHGLQEQLNASFLPKRYASGSVKVFNNHQLEMIVSKLVVLWFCLCFYRTLFLIRPCHYQRSLNLPLQLLPPL